MKPGFSTFDAAEYLRDKEDCQRYLEACLDEDPGDGSLIRRAIADIARAHGMSELAREAGISREGLYKALAPNGNPGFATMLKVIRALGLRLRIEPTERRQPTPKAHGHTCANGQTA